jgi:hypothetical protein
MSEIQELSEVLMQLQAVADDVKFTALPMLQDVQANYELEHWAAYWDYMGVIDGGFGNA